MGQSLLFLLSFVDLLTHVILTSVYLLVEFQNNTLEMETILGSYEAYFGLIHGITKLLSLRLNRDKIAVLINKSSKFLDLETCDEENIIADCKAYNSIITTMLRVLVAALFGNILVFNAAAVLLGDGDVSLLTIYKPSFVPGFIMYLGQNYVLVLVVTAVVAHDGILITCIIMAQVQFKLINNKLAKLFVKNQQYRKNDFDKIIKECVDHHNYLLEFVSYTNRTFSSTLLAYLAIVILAMCVEFYTVSKQISLEATLKALIYISAVLFQLVFFNCMPGQLLTNETEKTSEVAFYSNWEEVSSPSVMCAVKMIIHRTQKPVFISAGGILSINMGTGMATLKTIFSYYMFLRTVTEVVD